MNGSEEFLALLNWARSDPAAYVRAVEMPNPWGAAVAKAKPRPPLKLNSHLMKSAQFKATEMVRLNYFAHRSPLGVMPNKLVRSIGYPLVKSWPNNANYVESLAAGFRGDQASQCLYALLQDYGVPGAYHRVHLLGMSAHFARHKHIGVGQAEYYWCIHTAYPKGS